MITVTTAAQNFNLVDLGVMRAALDIVDNSDDAALTGFISRASDVIARHCNRVFAKETVVETFRPTQRMAELMLSRYPVVSVTSIDENGTTISADDYEVDQAKGFITRLHGSRPCYWSTARTIVTYVAGYDLPASSPPALQQACIQLVKSYFMGFDRDPMVRSESADGVASTSFHGDAGHLPPDVATLLRQFRKIK